MKNNPIVHTGNLATNKTRAEVVVARRGRGSPPTQPTFGFTQTSHRSYLVSIKISTYYRASLLGEHDGPDTGRERGKQPCSTVYMDKHNTGMDQTTNTHKEPK